MRLLNFGKVNKSVFSISTIFVVIFVAVVGIWHDDMEQSFLNIKTFISDYFGWYYILLINVLLIVCMYLLFGRYGNIRIGGTKAKPEFTYWQWFAMLFNAGIGLALMFYSLAEPISHYASPPEIPILKNNPAQLAFGISFLHWGLHGWAIYGIVGLCVAFFTYNYGLPLSLRSTLYPLLGNRIYGKIGNVIDILCVIATLFGLATTLGLGIQYVSAGLDYLFKIENSLLVQIALITILTLGAITSLILGLKKGIKNLSLISAWLAVSILLYVFIVGPTFYLLESMIQNTGYYLRNIVVLGTWSEINSGTNWQNDWTLFYWGWWFSWAPFVGLFIARISKGRTIKEFVGGTILVPTLTIIIWITIFGGAGIFEEIYGNGGIVEAIGNDITYATFFLLEKYPLTFLVSLLLVITSAIFYITSSDSGSFIIVTLSSSLDGDNAPKPQRIFWAVLEGLIAAMLIFAGGIMGLQTASLMSGLPVAILTVPMLIALFKGLKQELKKQNSELKD